jgi:hypothetical protein
MSTIRQQKLAQAIVENAVSDEPKPAGQLLENVGYSEHLAKQPGRVLQADGVQEELEKLGFTENNAKKVVAQILNNEEVEPNSRLKAADMTFKIHGSYAPEKSQSINLNVNATVGDEKSKALVEEFESKLFNDYQE